MLDCARGGNALKFYLISPLPDDNVLTYLDPDQDGNGTVVFMASAGPATVAALAPPDIEVELCDERVQPVDFDTDAEMIGLSALVTQTRRTIELAAEFRKRGKTVIIGGPHPSLDPDVFEPHADVLAVGEFEGMAEALFADMKAGTLKPRYDCALPDMALSPTPRWDLYPNEKANFAALQTSRGCPYQCEFCDAIVFMGRAQRFKSDDQVIEELQALYDLGHDTIFLTDDNFTIYRRRCRELLERIRAWNGTDGRDKLALITQMSVDVAREPELMKLCAQAGLQKAFIGIESVNDEAMEETKKVQNARIDLLQAMDDIIAHGIRISAGLMVGFDSDATDIFQRQYEFAMSSPVLGWYVSVLNAPTGTPLYARLEKDNRLRPPDFTRRGGFSGTLVANFQPAQMSRAELAIGTKWLISRLYNTQAMRHRLQRFAKVYGQEIDPAWLDIPGRDHASRLPTRRAVQRSLRALIKREPDFRAALRDVDALSADRPAMKLPIAKAVGEFTGYRAQFESVGSYDPAWAEMDAPPFHLAEELESWMPQPAKERWAAAE